jgi:molecular chaperone DnaK
LSFLKRGFLGTFMGFSIGIDLGTSVSAVAWVNASGKPEIIRNEYARSVTPTVIAFENGVPVVGDKAKQQQRTGKQIFAQLFKRCMDNADFLLTVHEREYTPIDLATLVLSYLKAQAERYLKGPVTDAVITVPAYFTDPQRRATIEAGKRAGLNILSIIDEPTAAALAYDLFSEQNGRQLLLAYDLGGGTFDISLISTTANTFSVVATDGHNWLGGVNWDTCLLLHATKEFKQAGIEPTERELMELHFHIEQAKHALSVRKRVEISLELSGQRKTCVLTRDLFESLTFHLLEETRLITNRLLQEAGVGWNDLDNVLLVGGATRMPMVRTYVEQMLGKPPVTSIHPEEAVALGAAIATERARAQAGLDSQAPHSLTHKRITHVIAHSLGLIVKSADGSKYINSILIRKNSPVPATATRSYQVHIQRNGKIQLEIFLTQGESSDPQYCIYLGKYLFSGRLLFTDPTVVIDVTYQYDENGVVHIAASEHTYRLPLNLSIEAHPLDVPDRFMGQPASQLGQEPMTVYLAIDLSGSMDERGKDSSDRPFDKAKQAISSFVEESNLATTSIGLLSFSDRVALNLAASQNKAEIYQALERLAPGQTGYGNNGHPFDELYKLLAPTSQQRYAVILTDGLWACPELAIRGFQRCQEAGIEVFSVGFGATNAQFLARIASSAEQSKYVPVEQLQKTFSTIAQEIAELGSSS